MLILVAAFAGLGIIWMLAWMLVTVVLLLVVVLALFDALRTHQYHNQKMPELRRQFLGDDDRR